MMRGERDEPKLELADGTLGCVMLFGSIVIKDPAAAV
jgi:hypothetical protein